MAAMVNAGEIAASLGRMGRIGDAFLADCPLLREHLDGEGPALRLSERIGHLFVRCSSTHLFDFERVHDTLRERGLLPVGDDLVVEMDDFEEDLALTMPPPLSIRGLYECVGKTPIEDPEDDATEGSVSDSEQENLPTAPPCAPFSRWEGLDLLTEEQRRDVIQAYRDEGLSDEEISQKKIAIDAAAYRASEVTRLARMSSLERDPLLKSTAKRLELSVSTLKDAIKQQNNVQAASPQTGEIAKSPAADAPTWAEPQNIWPEPVNGAALVSELSAAIRKFVALSQADALVAALWILFTWTFETAAETNPYLRIISATLACGKSTLLKALKYLVRSGWLISRLSPSSFTRTLGRERRTLLLDETDAFLHENESMRNLLDGASDPDTSTVSFSTKSGDDWTPIELDVYVPIAMASIGTLRRMQTVESRSIQIHLKRATPLELKRLSKGRRRELKSVLEPLATKCARWVNNNAGKLTGAQPEMPDTLSGRDQDKWEPLIAIADLISPECGKEAREVAVTIVTAGNGDDEPLGVSALRDIRQLFDERHADKLASKEICDALAALEGRPWASYGKDPKPLTPNQLARLLKGFLIVPHTIRLDERTTSKGYEREDFTDAWERYQIAEKKADSLSNGDLNRHNVTTQRGVSRNGDFQSVTETSCDGSKKELSPNGEKLCDVVTVEKATSGPKDQIFDADDRDDDDPEREDF